MTVYYDASRIEPGAPASMLAIGDSWFWYPFVSNLLAEVSAIVRPDYSNILTLGQVGAKLEQYADGKFAPQLARQFKPQFIRYYSALLISGGGNDAVDWGLCLRQDCAGMQTAAECIDAQLLADSMSNLGGWLLSIINEASDACAAAARPRLDVFIHCYDYAPPNGKPARFPLFGIPLLGPWLKPAMDSHGVDPNDYALRQDIVKLLMQTLQTTFMEFDSPSDKVHVIRTVGTLDPDTDWANELHPNGEGFRKLAHGPWLDSLRRFGYAA
jgi:hypothetical protein